MKFPQPRIIDCTTPPGIFRDTRGWFQESWKSGSGIPPMKAGMTSFSEKGVLRGLHFQRKFPRTLLVRCVRGVIWDVALDIRKGSPTLGRWHGNFLDDQNGRSVLIPAGHAHGFYAIEDALVVYECSDHYHAESAETLRYTAANGAWQHVMQDIPTLSEKDAKAPPAVDAIEMAP